MSVTIRLKAPYHSMYFGNPFSAPSSIKSKSKTRLNAATPTMIKDMPMLIGEFEVIKLRVEPKKAHNKIDKIQKKYSTNC